MDLNNNNIMDLNGNGSYDFNSGYEAAEGKLGTGYSLSIYRL
jgi:hypothetical protein